MYIDSGKITSTWGKESPVLPAREEFKIELARDDQGKLIVPGWKRTQDGWTKKESQGSQLILKKQLNNPQSLTNRVTSNKLFILFKLFLPKSRHINLALLVAN